MFIIHSSVDKPLGCFQLLAIMDRAAVNMSEQVFLWWNIASTGYMPKSGIPGSVSNFLRSHDTDFNSGCKSLHSYQHGGVFPFPHTLASTSCHLFY